MVAKLIEILCVGDNKIGYGHIRRSLTLASKLESEGLNVKISGLSEETLSFLPPPRFSGVLADIQIFDAPSGIDQMLRLAKISNQITVALDWFGDEIPDINIAIYPHRYLRGKRKTYLGFENIMIRDEISNLRKIPACVNTKLNKVIISIGGGDRLNQAHRAAEILIKKGLHVTLIQGPFVSQKFWNVDYKILNCPQNFPKLLNECDWAVTNGGGTMFEAMCLGKAAVILPQTEDERKLACFASSKGAILGIGFDNLRSFSSEEVRRVGLNGAALVDGGGIERVSAIIRGII